MISGITVHITSAYSRKILVLGHMLPLNLSKKAIKRQLNRYGYENYRLLLQLLRADRLSVAPEFREKQEKEVIEAEKLLDEIISESECFSLKDLAINGRDLMPLGLQGKQIGDALEFLLDNVIDGKVENEKEKLIEFWKGQA